VGVTRKMILELDVPDGTDYLEVFFYPAPTSGAQIRSASDAIDSEFYFIDELKEV
jgi:hypothetical protein